MIIAKQEVFELIKDLPDEVDIDEIIYRLYLRQKLESAVQRKTSARADLFYMRKSSRRLLSGLQNKMDYTSTQ